MQSSPCSLPDRPASFLCTAIDGVKQLAMKLILLIGFICTAAFGLAWNNGGPVSAVSP